MKTDYLLSKIISHLFHPLLLPTFGLFLIFNLDETGLWIPSSGMRLFLYGITFTATFLLPLLNAFLLLKMNYISSFEMKTKEERKLPFFFSTISYFSELYLLMNWDSPALVRAMMMETALLILSVWLINFFWKISAHTTGIGGLCGMMIGISYRLQINIHLLLIALFLIAGLIAFARVKLDAHSPAQVYAGFLLGVFVPLVLFL